MDQITKQRISKTKSETGRKDILEGAQKCHQKKSSIQLAVPTHRKKELISLEEYKKLLQDGKTVLDVCKITSKQLVYFYSALLKGRITLSKEDFENMYEQGMSLDDIAKKSGVSRESITQLREFYGIKRKGATFQKRVAEEQPLSQEAKDIIIGSLLGDGHITNWGYFSEKHSPAQLQYLQWKASFFNELTTDKSWAYYESVDKRSGSIIKTHSFRTRVHSWIQEMERLWYKKVDGKRIKIVPEQIEEWMNEQILAIWFMDDGKTDWMLRPSKSKNASPASALCTDSFSEQEIYLLQKTLRQKFNLLSTLSPRNRIIFSVIDTRNLHSIIKTKINADLLYKIDKEAYREK